MPSVDVTTSSTLAIPAKDNRRILMIQNESDTDIYIGFTSGVTVADGANSGIKLPANGGMVSMPDLPSNERFGNRQVENDGGIYAVHGGSGTKKLRYIEL